MGLDPVGVSPERRARLALKARILYAKSCGTMGKRTCAESFALYHIGRGESEIARDLLVYLQTEIESLRRHDPKGRLAMTEELAARIQRHLEADGQDRPDPSQWATLLKAKPPRS